MADSPEGKILASVYFPFQGIEFSTDTLEELARDCKTLESRLAVPEGANSMQITVRYDDGPTDLSTPFSYEVEFSHSDGQGLTRLIGDRRKYIPEEVLRLRHYAPQPTR